MGNRNKTLKMEESHKMALRNQPDRKAKKKPEIEEPGNVNIIQNLLSNYGMTGENLVREIFSNLDFSSIQGSRLVCKTWNHFLTNDRTVWMAILKRTQPYLEFLSYQLMSDHEEEKSAVERTVWKDLFTAIETREDFSYGKILDLFKKIQLIFAGIEEWNNGISLSGCCEFLLPNDYMDRKVEDRDIGPKLMEKINEIIEQESDPLVKFLYKKFTEIEKKEMDVENIDVLTDVSIFEEHIADLFQKIMLDAENSIKETQNEVQQRIKAELYSVLNN